MDKPSLSFVSYVRSAVWPQLHGWVLGAAPIAAGVALVYAVSKNLFTDQPYTLLQSIELDATRCDICCAIRCVC